MGATLVSRWWIVLACACGLCVGTGSIMIFSFGVFLKPVTEDLGLSRGDLSSALGVSTWLTALAGLVVGWLIDRWGTRRILIPGILLFAIAIASLGLMQAQPLSVVFLIYAAAWIIGGVQTPIPYAAVVSQWFDRSRGLALGLATGGVGIGVVLIPQLAAFLIDRELWDDFVAAVDDQRRRNPGLALDLSGPWPPFDFVRMQFGA